MPRLRLRMKIMICCVGLVALLDLMVVVFVRAKLSDTLRAESWAKGDRLAVGLANRGEHFVLTEEFVALLRLVTDVKAGDEDVAYAYVMDREGRVLAHTFAGGFPADLIDVNPAGGDASVSRMALDGGEEGLIHDFAAAILQGKVGSVHVGVSEKRMTRTIAQFTLAIVLIAGLVLLVAIVLAGIVSSVVTQPVRNLTSAARRIREGDLGQKVEATTRDEIGDLVDSFNLMSEELLKQHRVLDDRNQRIRIAREQAAGERDKLRAIIDSMVEGVIFVDADGSISLCNESAERIWGMAAEDMLGKPLLNCHPLEAREEVAKILEHAKATPGFAVVEEMAVGKAHSRLSNYSSVHGQGGRYLGLVLLSQDISERVKLEQERQGLRDQLFQQEKMVLIGQIAASVAHEINTPLGTILLRAELVQHEMADQGDLSDIEVIRTEAQRCRRIIDSLLGFSRRSEGMLSKTNVNYLIRESLFLMENDLALKSISLGVEYAKDEALICVDANQLQQVFLNLFTNAADAMPDGGRLQIVTGVSSDGDSVTIQVTDTGSGMDQSVLDRAFDPFFTTKERGKGTGLGLAICQRIVEEHKGQIEIDSQVGSGTTVLVRLPRVCSEAVVND